MSLAGVLENQLGGEINMMSIIRFLVLWLLFTLYVTVSAVADSGGSLPDPGQNPMQIVMADITRQVVAGMPEDPLYRKLALGEITGDDGSFKDVLRSTVVAVTDFDLLDYATLLKILEEEEQQKNNIVKNIKVLSGSSKIREGGWLLSGRIIDKFENPLYCSMETFLELKNTETDEIAFSRNFGSSYIPPLTKYLATALLTLAVLLLLLRANRQRDKNRVAQAIKEYNEAQLTTANELKKSRDNLQRVHDSLVGAERVALAVKVKEQQGELDNLIFSVEQHPGPHSETVNRKSGKDQQKHNKFMLGLVRNLGVESEKLLKYVKTNNDMATEATLEVLANEIKNCSNKTYNDTVGRA